MYKNGYHKQLRGGILPISIMMVGKAKSPECFYLKGGYKVCRQGTKGLDYKVVNQRGKTVGSLGGYTKPPEKEVLIAHAKQALESSKTWERYQRAFGSARGLLRTHVSIVRAVPLGDVLNGRIRLRQGVEYNLAGFKNGRISINPDNSYHITLNAKKDPRNSAEIARLEAFEEIINSNCFQKEIERALKGIDLPIGPDDVYDIKKDLERAASFEKNAGEWMTIEKAREEIEPAEDERGQVEEMARYEGLRQLLNSNAYKNVRFSYDPEGNIVSAHIKTSAPEQFLTVTLDDTGKIIDSFFGR